MGLRYGTYPSPLCPLTHHQSWEVCRGRRRAHRTKAVPGPTSPLPHDTPKAGRAGQRAPATSPKLLFIVSSSYPQEQDTFPAGLCGTLPRLLLETNNADVLICDQALNSGCASLSEQPVKHAADSWRLIHTSTMTHAAVKTQRGRGQHRSGDKGGKRGS